MHADFALGGDLARRYPAKIAPMAGVREISNASLNALAALMRPGDVVGLFGPEPVSEAGDLLVVSHKHIDQMICDRQDNSPQTGPVTELTPADVPDMLHLVELTSRQGRSCLALTSVFAARASSLPWRASE